VPSLSNCVSLLLLGVGVNQRPYIIGRTQMKAMLVKTSSVESRRPLLFRRRRIRKRRKNKYDEISIFYTLVKRALIPITVIIADSNLSFYWMLDPMSLL